MTGQTNRQFGEQHFVDDLFGDARIDFDQDVTELLRIYQTGTASAESAWNGGLSIKPRMSPAARKAPSMEI